MTPMEYDRHKIGGGDTDAIWNGEVWKVKIVQQDKNRVVLVRSVRI